jgi:hypothetical protein
MNMLGDILNCCIFWIASFLAMMIHADRHCEERSNPEK